MKALITSIVFIACSAWAVAQSNLMEGNNSFALYTKTGDFKQLEAARKYADEAYKTRRDSAGFRNNLLRGLVYSTLAVADSNRTQKYSSDPINIAMQALNTLTSASTQVKYENESEINYIRRSLANAYLIRANRAVVGKKYNEAFTLYKKVDSLGAGAYQVSHNLAVLSKKIGDEDGAIRRYESMIKSRETARPGYIIELTDLYWQKGDHQSALNTLITGRELYSGNKEILFKLINTYVAHDAYDAIIPLLDEALAHEPENVNLNYIAGFTYETAGNFPVARRYYEKVIGLDANNFEGNFQLGLLYLREYIQNPADGEKQNKAQEYLLRANQIKPSAINALKSLAVLYDQSGDIIQLERVNNILNQRIID